MFKENGHNRDGALLRSIFFRSRFFSSPDSGSAVSAQNSGTTSPDLSDSSSSSSKQSGARKTPESFLGSNAALVNLDSLVSKPPQPAPSLNPFLAPGTSSPRVGTWGFLESGVADGGKAPPAPGGLL